MSIDLALVVASTCMCVGLPLLLLVIGAISLTMLSSEISQREHPDEE
jgi:hypothetical protein